jgi:hypothetical protein
MASIFSYVRFSSKPQEQGDSVRRQTGLGDAWMKRNPQHTLDTTLRLRDLGISAFKGANLDKDRGDLGRFIHLAKTGKIPAGSILMLENLDRFSRQPPRKVFHVFCELVECGITIQTLSPEQTISAKNIDAMEVVLPTIIAMQLGFQESQKKSERLLSAWSEKRKQLGNGKRLTKHCPAWLSWNDEAGKWAVKPGAQTTLGYIFQRTIDGCGQNKLLGELQERFTPFNGKAWSGTSLNNILCRREVLGELLPQRRVKGNQEPIKGYYPALIKEEAWLQARGASTARKKLKGRCRQFVNLFVGLLKFPDGLAGHVYSVTQPQAKIVYRRLASAGHRKHVMGACKLSIEYWKVERHILGALFQIKGSDLLPGQTSDPSAGKRGELAAVAARLKQLTDALTAGDESVPQLLTAIKDLTVKQAAIRRQIEASDVSKAVGEQKPFKAMQDVLTTIDQAPESERHDLRLKLRQLVSAVVKEIRVEPYRGNGNHVEAKITIVFLDASTVETLYADTADGIQAASALRDVIRKVPAGVLASARLISSTNTVPVLAVRMAEKQVGEAFSEPASGESYPS